MRAPAAVGRATARAGRPPPGGVSGTRAPGRRPEEREKEGGREGGRGRGREMWKDTETDDRCINR